MQNSRDLPSPARGFRVQSHGFRQVEDTMAQMMHLRMRPPKEVEKTGDSPGPCFETRGKTRDIGWIAKYLWCGVKVKIGS